MCTLEASKSFHLKREQRKFKLATFHQEAGSKSTVHTCSTQQGTFMNTSQTEDQKRTADSHAVMA